MTRRTRRHEEIVFRTHGKPQSCSSPLARTTIHVHVTPTCMCDLSRFCFWSTIFAKTSRQTYSLFILRSNLHLPISYFFIISLSLSHCILCRIREKTEREERIVSVLSWAAFVMNDRQNVVSYFSQRPHVCPCNFSARNMAAETVVLQFRFAQTPVRIRRLFFSFCVSLSHSEWYPRLRVCTGHTRPRSGLFTVSGYQGISRPRVRRRN